MENNNDFNEMRSQIELLKKALNEEKMVNERLIRSAMGTKMKWIMRRYWLDMAIMLIMIPYCGYVLTQLTDNSTAFIIVTELFMFTGLLFHWYVHRGISTNAIVNGDLVTTGRKLVNLKLMTTRWQRFGIPFLFIWFTWFLWENVDYRDIPWIGIIGSACGAALGFVVALYQCRRQRRVIDELICQIDEIAKEQ